MPDLHLKLRRLIHERRFPDEDVDEVEDDALPHYEGRLSIYDSASAIFYAPSELAGPHGMHLEIIRSKSLWRGEYERRDTVLVKAGDNNDILGGMYVARIVRFLSFTYDGVRQPCALVEWYLPLDAEPDEVTGMWRVRSHLQRRRRGEQIARRHMDLIRLEDIVRGCHLVPEYGERWIDHTHFSHSLLRYRTFFVNHYIDFHSHECIPR
jgi:hypothetical protein